MDVTLQIKRFNPEVDKRPHWETYTVDVDESDRVLDALHQVKWHQDGSLAFRRSCAHGVCGSGRHADGQGHVALRARKTEGGNVAAIVAKAKAAGLSHLYVRTGSSWNGFYAGPFLDQILPAAHEADLLVYGWDFPRLIDPQDDVRRAKAAIDHRAPGKHRIDGFSADIETRSEGTHITGRRPPPSTGGRCARRWGSSFPLIATVPRPSPAQNYPYAEVVASFDAIAPMVYWLNRQPDTDVTGALRDLAQYGKPVFPVGQAYDGAPEGGRAGVPPPEELWRFMRFAEAGGAQGVSFWSWQAANSKAWAAIRDASEYRGPGQVAA